MHYGLNPIWLLQEISGFLEKGCATRSKVVRSFLEILELAAETEKFFLGRCHPQKRLPHIRSCLKLFEISKLATHNKGVEDNESWDDA